MALFNKKALRLACLCLCVCVCARAFLGVTLGLHLSHVSSQEIYGPSHKKTQKSRKKLERFLRPPPGGKYGVPGSSGLIAS